MATPTTTAARGTFTKLRSGWGVRIRASIAKGTTLPVDVTKKSGEVTTETCKVIWSDAAVSLAVIERGARPRNGRPPYRHTNARAGRGAARYCWECGSTHTGGIGDECGD